MAFIPRRHRVWSVGKAAETRFSGIFNEKMDRITEYVANMIAFYAERYRSFRHARKWYVDCTEGCGKLRMEGIE